MPDKSAKGIDRRDLIIASVATVGAAAAIAVNASDANAQGAATPPANPTSGTVYTGDVIEGKKVVSALDVNDLEPGKKHLRRTTSLGRCSDISFRATRANAGLRGCGCW